jgi:hypothetical protein
MSVSIPIRMISVGFDWARAFLEAKAATAGPADSSSRRVMDINFPVP